MKQKRITDFFPTAVSLAGAAKPASFLSLPTHVRRAIYLHAGVEQGTENFIDLNCWSHRQPDWSVYDDDTDDSDSENGEPIVPRKAPFHPNWKSKIPVNLLQSSRVVHDEVEEIIYQSHVWGASSSGPGGLDVLENLSPRAINSMRSLLVSLTPCACSGCVATGTCPHPIPAHVRLYFGVQDKWASRTSDLAYNLDDSISGDENTWGNETPLDVRTRRDRCTLVQWDRICDRIAKYAQPRSLNLHVFCIVKDVATAELITSPLSKLAPLNGLGILFEQRKGTPHPCREQLSSLARTTIQHVKYQARFPFFRLPTELQLHVLSFTNLVLRGWEVKYCSGWRPKLSCPNEDGDGEHTRDFARMDGTHAWLLAEAFCANGNIGCSDFYCCHQLPVSFFLVSRRFRDLAYELFYGRNRIVASYNDITWYTGVDKKKATMKWDLNSPPLVHVLQHITHLTLTAYVPRNLSTMDRFLRLNKLLRAHTRLRTLTLELHVHDRHTRDETLAALAGVVRGVPRPSRRHAEIYRLIFQSIRKQLAGAGLKAFFLYLWRDDPNFGTLEERREIEREKERQVMGDGYSSERLGKELHGDVVPRSAMGMYWHY